MTETNKKGGKKQYCPVFRTNTNQGNIDWINYLMLTCTVTLKVIVSKIIDHTIKVPLSFPGCRQKCKLLVMCCFIKVLFEIWKFVTNR